MQPWAVEYGTLWGLETDNDLPPICPAHVEVEFKEVNLADIDDLVGAMGLSNPEPVQHRLQSGRRCFGLSVENRIITYGWVTCGVEYVGELDRRFNLHQDEAYIWDCGTLPAWRGQRCYSALLSRMIYRLHDEDIPRIWIGTSRLNRPSIRGIANAGFKSVVDCTYYRFYRMTFM